jgi:prepilin-type N-terminal cleavage/methylation domain-containing protein
MKSAPGFSLIEILVVITIIGLLIGLSAGAYTQWIQRGEEAKTDSVIQNLGVYAEEYVNVCGDYPPSSLKYLGISSTGDSANEGIEALVAALFRKNYTGARPGSASDLVNTDEDSADKNISSFATAVLLEFQDAWYNPVIYISCRDYSESFTYLIESPETDREPVEVQALINPVTGTFYNFDSYQLISVGPDGIFDTEDDLANFTRQE